MRSPAWPGEEIIVEIEAQLIAEGRAGGVSDAGKSTCWPLCPTPGRKLPIIPSPRWEAQSRGGYPWATTAVFVNGRHPRYH